MLPKIIAYAKRAFRGYTAEAKQEALQNVVANSCAAVAGLAKRGKLDLAYPAVLAKFGIRQTLDHRLTGNSLNVRDVLSKYCQDRKGIVVERLDRHDKDDENTWCEVLVEDRHAGPAEIACTRIDFTDWLASLNRRDRRVAEFLANGESTRAAAKKFGISDGRVSQLRKELAASWQRFIGDEPGPAAVAA
jgi:hypothetical protein